MIRKYIKKDFLSVVDFVSKNPNPEFYVTNHNTRTIVSDIRSTTLLLKTSRVVRISDDHGDVNGVLAVWKSEGEVPRHYVKLVACNSHVAKGLLISLLWNDNLDFFVKIKKTSPYMKIFTNKGFKFQGDRGSEMLLRYNNVMTKKTFNKDENGYDKDKNTKFIKR